MKRNRWLWIIAIISILALIAPFSLPSAHAQTSYTFDFSGSNGGWTAEYAPPPNDYTAGEYSSGAWNATCNDATGSGDPGHYGYVALHYTVPSATTVTAITIHFDRALGPQSITALDDLVYHDDSSSIPNRYVSQLDTVIGSGTNLEFSWTGSATSGSVIGFTLSYDYSVGGCTGYVHVHSVDITTSDSVFPTPTPTATPAPTTTPVPDTSWAYPIATQDRITTDQSIYSMRAPFNGWNDTGTDSTPNATILFGKSSETYVHSVVAGTVTGVDPLTTQCVNTRDITRTSTLYLGQTNAPYSCYNSDDPGFREEYLSYEGLYKVAVTIEDNKVLYYIVSNPRVVAGQTVSKGCILGNTGATKYRSLVGFGNGTDFYTIVQGYDITASAVFDVQPYFIEEPNNVICGGTGAQSGNCKLIANPTFTNSLYGWNLDSDPVMHLEPNIDPGGGLLLVGRISQPNINLDPSQDYRITLKFHTTTPGSVNFSVQLGSGAASEVNTTTEGFQSKTVVIGPDTFTPTESNDIGNFYTLSLSDFQASAQHAIIDFVCVSDEADNLPADPGGCILRNPEFDDATEGWTVADGASMRGDGAAITINGSSLTQSLKLSPLSSGPLTYVISVTARSSLAQTTPNYSVDYEWGSASGTLSAFDAASYWVIKQDEFSVTTTETNDLILTIDGPTDNTLIIDTVCVKTVDNKPPPGYQPPPSGAYCKLCHYSPVGDISIDAPNLIFWIWCNITQLWNCDARRILYGIWEAIIQTLTFFGFLRLWIASAVLSFGTWLNSTVGQAIAWLNGSSLNFMHGLGVAPSGSGTNFFDVLIAFINGLRDIVLQTINALLTLITAVLGLLGAILTTIANLGLSAISTVVNVIPAIVLALANGFNAAASTIPLGAPNCSDPTSIIYGPCLGLYVLDNTILSGPGRFLIPFVIAAGFFSLLMWAFDQLRGAFDG